MKDGDKISYRKKQMPKLYEELEKQVIPLAHDTAFRWSYHGVPHMLVELANHTIYSICFLGRRSIWRVFFPYRSDKQRKLDFASIDDVLAFLKMEVA